MLKNPVRPDEDRRQIILQAKTVLRTPQILETHFYKLAVFPTDMCNSRFVHSVRAIRTMKSGGTKKVKTKRANCSGYNLIAFYKFEHWQLQGILV